MKMEITELDYVHALLKEAGEKGMSVDEFRKKIGVSYKEAKTSMDDFAKINNRAVKNSVRTEGKGAEQRYYLKQ
ncbi:MAG: hypothetical protein PHU12_02660 [Candidatus Aenigmarchaeota archaeon]|nr:hypothetical protein [Candidatus Aenigmarchaeota archaeon]